MQTVRVGSDGERNKIVTTMFVSVQVQQPSGSNALRRNNQNA